MKHNVGVCKVSWNYYGFILMPGFIFGRTSDKIWFTSNGKQKQNNNVPFYNAYIVTEDGLKEYELEQLIDDSRARHNHWRKIRITEENNPEIFYLITKGAKEREEKGIQIEYKTSSELEEERWKKRREEGDISYYSQSVPYNAPRGGGHGFMSSSPFHVINIRNIASEQYGEDKGKKPPLCMYRSQNTAQICQLPQNKLCYGKNCLYWKCKFINNRYKSNRRSRTDCIHHRKKKCEYANMENCCPSNDLAFCCDYYE